MIKARVVKVIVISAVTLLVVLAAWLAIDIFFARKIESVPIKSQSENIIINSPFSDEVVDRHLIVEGLARVFENQFNWSVLDANSQKEVASGTVYANAQDAGLFGSFKIETILPYLNTNKIILRVFDRSPKDGSIIDLIEMPLKFNNDLTDAYQIYFPNKNLDSETTCLKVFPVTRSVSAEKLTLKGILDLLLKGLTDKEKEDGYSNSIPENVKINFINDEGSIVKIDFSKDIENGVAGSCRVTAIRAQIYWTVISFDKNARSVIISVDGDVRGALQP
jgi:hypothetical protein